MSSPSASTSTTATTSSVDTLVARIALYPDDLVAIILPASTFPIQVVEAARFLERQKKDKSAKPKESWDKSVQALVNYPDVVRMMNEDLDWTTALGEAVVADQGNVMDAIQGFRRKVQSAGNLKSDDKLKVSEEDNIIVVEQADPQVIYVPTYEPTTVVVPQPYPVYTYSPPYPVYYYPYPPGYSFASGFFWGVTTAWMFNWHSNSIDIDIDRNVNRNFDRNVDRNGNRERTGNRSGTTKWEPSKRPGEVRSGVSNRAQFDQSRRPGDSNFNPSQYNNRGGSQGSRDFANSGARDRAAAGSRDVPRQQPADMQRYQKNGQRYDSFSGQRSGNQALRDSNRGASSRNRGSWGSSGRASRGGGGRRR